MIYNCQSNLFTSYGQLSITGSLRISQKIKFLKSCNSEAI